MGVLNVSEVQKEYRVLFGRGWRPIGRANGTRLRDRLLLLHAPPGEVYFGVKLIIKERV